MNKKIWIVNDSLGQLGEVTLWHDLLGTFAGSEAITGPYESLAERVENIYKDSAADLIIRNATYFRPINVPCPQISIAQDIIGCPGCDNGRWQQEVISKSAVTVYNTLYTANKIGLSRERRIIPIGTDFDFWYPERSTITENQKGLISKTVLWVGSSHQVKGWQLFQQIVENSDLHFICVTKDESLFIHPRCDSLGRVSQERLRELASYCSAFLCTSETETQHLAGIEAGACGLSIVAPPVGIYSDLGELMNQKIGRLVSGRDPGPFIEALYYVLSNRESYTPRDTLLSYGLDKKTCLERWKSLVEEVLG